MSNSILKFALKRSFDPSTFVPDFDLIRELTESYSRYIPEPSAPASWLTIYYLPGYVEQEIDRCLNGTRLSREAAMTACIVCGIDHVMGYPAYDEVVRIRELIMGPEAKKLPAEDYENLTHNLQQIVLAKNDGGTKFTRRNLRVPEYVRKQLGEMSRNLDIPLSDLARVCLMDGLRLQDTIRDDRAEAMWSAIDELLIRLDRQVRRMDGLLEKVGLKKPAAAPKSSATP